MSHLPLQAPGGERGARRDHEPKTYSGEDPSEQGAGIRMDPALARHCVAARPLCTRCRFQRRIREKRASTACVLTEEAESGPGHKKQDHSMVRGRLRLCVKRPRQSCLRAVSRYTALNAAHGCTWLADSDLAVCASTVRFSMIEGEGGGRRRKRKKE